MIRDLIVFVVAPELHNLRIPHRDRNILVYTRRRPTARNRWKFGSTVDLARRGG